MAKSTGDEVIDLDHPARPEGAMVPGAQWDERRGCWEHWDEASGSWLAVGAEAPISPPAVDVDVALHMIELPPEADDEDIDQVIDLQLVPRPPGPAIPGAQWNEVAARWERWDDAAHEWVDAGANASST